MVTLQQMVESLNGDLANEYKHWHFYMHAALRVQGLHRQAVRDFLLAEAASEMLHIQEFGDLIVGLNGIPATSVNGFRSDFTQVMDILNYAKNMEEEVINNYVARKKEAKTLGGVNGVVIEAFLDNQILASRHDADHIRQMLSGL